MIIMAIMLMCMMIIMVMFSMIIMSIMCKMIIMAIMLIFCSHQLIASIAVDLHLIACFVNTTATLQIEVVMRMKVEVGNHCCDDNEQVNL